VIDVPVLLLAIEDYAPVVLSALALAALARTSRDIDPAVGSAVTAAAVLIPVGGLSKPTYKTILALSGGAWDVVVLDDLLFWFLAPGFILLTVGIAAARRVDSGLTSGDARWLVRAAIAVMVTAGVLAVSGSDAWFFLLLTVATVANVLAVIELVRWTIACATPTAAWLYLLSLAIVFGLAGAAAALDQAIAVQWGEQLASTASQVLFLVASLNLVRVVRTEEAPAITISIGRGS
jgi:hypothetical protein